MRRIWFHILHTLLPLGALALHVLIFAAYARRWDKMAALTVFPFWAWGLLGMGMAGFAWLFTKQRLALAVTALWSVTILVFADETRMLLRSWKTQPEPGMPVAAADGSRVRRVISLNCKGGQWNPASVDEVIKWEPDVVLFQESADRAVLDQAARKLYGGQPGEHSEATWECGVITRGQIRRSVKNNLQGNLSVTIQFDDGTFLEVASVHLRGAETDVRLYTRETLYKHALNRKARRTELQKIVTMQTMVNGERPALIGGDFNAPAGDAIFRLLSGAGFKDAMVAAGGGWPNTYPNQAPMLRIDQQWVNARCVPLRGRVVKTQNSDHRMVICDYLIK